jgi:formate dehydrogenase subunit beta
MKVEAVLKTEEGDILGALRNFLGRLLQEGVVDYLLVPLEISHGRTLVPTLVKDPAYLNQANPFSPVMPVSSASIVAQLTIDKPEKKLGVVMKPCEIRALVELVKLGQANLENVVIIGTDCLGTYGVEDYAKLIDEMKGAAEKKGEKVLADMRQGTEMPISLRPACKMCNAFTPLLANITMGLFGVPNGVFVSLDDKLAEQLGLEVKEAPDRQPAIDQFLESQNAAREQVFEEFRERMKTVVDFASCLDTCILCYACSSACPLCYCRICFFRTDTFEPESERYYRWADKEGVLRMPTEILLYHLTRLNHVAISCCGCGMCESACPRKLPLTAIFQTVGDGLQKALNYVPGRSLEEPIPLATLPEVRV